MLATCVAEAGSSEGQQLSKGPSVKIKLTVKPSKRWAAEADQSDESASDAEISDSDEPDSPQAGNKKKLKGRQGLDQVHKFSLLHTLYASKSLIKARPHMGMHMLDQLCRQAAAQVCSRGRQTWRCYLSNAAVVCVLQA